MTDIDDGNGVRVPHVLLHAVRVQGLERALRTRSDLDHVLLLGVDQEAAEGVGREGALVAGEDPDGSDGVGLGQGDGQLKR